MTLDQSISLIVRRRARQWMSSALWFLLLFAIGSVPNVVGAKMTRPRAHVSPLCAAWMATSERWTEANMRGYSRLTSAKKRKIDQQIARQYERQYPRHMCDTPAFIRQSRDYVAEMRKWNRKLTRQYQTLLHRLHGAARRHLIRDEQRWDGYHALENTNPANGINQYAARVNRLRELRRELSVGPYPFISDHVIIKNYYFNSGSLHTVVHYPQFDNGGRNAAKINRFFAKIAHRRSVEFSHLAAQAFAKPLAPHTPYPVDWFLSQWFTLHRPGPALVDIELSKQWYVGAVVDNGEEHSYLIDLRTDQPVTLQQIFQPGTHWRRRLVPIVTRNLGRQFGTRGRKDINTDDIVIALQHTSNYLFRDGSLVLIVDEGWPALDFAITVPYTQIRSLLRPHGLIALTAHSNLLPGLPISGSLLDSRGASSAVLWQVNLSFRFEGR